MLHAALLFDQRECLTDGLRQYTPHREPEGTWGETDVDEALR
ncbi:MAG: hypothetical protein R6X06_00865 [Gammaproteobacteria bacterium]